MLFRRLLAGCFKNDQSSLVTERKRCALRCSSDVPDGHIDSSINLQASTGSCYLDVGQDAVQGVLPTLDQATFREISKQFNGPAAAAAWVIAGCPGSTPRDERCNLSGLQTLWLHVHSSSESETDSPAASRCLRTYESLLTDLESLTSQDAAILAGVEEAIRCALKRQYCRIRHRLLLDGTTLVTAQRGFWTSAAHRPILEVGSCLLDVEGGGGKRKPGLILLIRTPVARNAAAAGRGGGSAADAGAIGLICSNRILPLTYLPHPPLPPSSSSSCLNQARSGTLAVRRVTPPLPPPPMAQPPHEQSPSLSQLTPGVHPSVNGNGFHGVLLNTRPAVVDSAAAGIADAAPGGGGGGGNAVQPPAGGAAVGAPVWEALGQMMTGTAVGDHAEDNTMLAARALAAESIPAMVMAFSFDRSDDCSGCGNGGGSIIYVNRLARRYLNMLPSAYTNSSAIPEAVAAAGGGCCGGGVGGGSVWGEPWRLPSLDVWLLLSELLSGAGRSVKELLAEAAKQQGFSATLKAPAAMDILALGDGFPAATVAAAAASHCSPQPKPPTGPPGPGGCGIPTTSAMCGPAELAVESPYWGAISAMRPRQLMNGIAECDEVELAEPMGGESGNQGGPEDGGEGGAATFDGVDMRSGLPKLDPRVTGLPDLDRGASQPMPGPESPLVLQQPVFSPLPSFSLTAGYLQRQGSFTSSAGFPLGSPSRAESFALPSRMDSINTTHHASTTTGSVLLAAQAPSTAPASACACFTHGPLGSGFQPEVLRQRLAAAADTAVAQDAPSDQLLLQRLNKTTVPRQARDVSFQRFGAPPLLQFQRQAAAVPLAASAATADGSAEQLQWRQQQQRPASGKSTPLQTQPVAVAPLFGPHRQGEQQEASSTVGGGRGRGPELDDGGSGGGGGGGGGDVTSCGCCTEFSASQQQQHSVAASTSGRFSMTRGNAAVQQALDTHLLHRWSSMPTAPTRSPSSTAAVVALSPPRSPIGAVGPGSGLGRRSRRPLRRVATAASAELIMRVAALGRFGGGGDGLAQPHLGVGSFLSGPQGAMPAGRVAALAHQSQEVPQEESPYRQGLSGSEAAGDAGQMTYGLGPMANPPGGPHPWMEASQWKPSRQPNEAARAKRGSWTARCGSGANAIAAVEACSGGRSQPTVRMGAAVLLSPADRPSPPTRTPLPMGTMTAAGAAPPPRVEEQAGTSAEAAISMATTGDCCYTGLSAAGYFSPWGLHSCESGQAASSSVLRMLGGSRGGGAAAFSSEAASESALPPASAPSLGDTGRARLFRVVRTTQRTANSGSGVSSSEAVSQVYGAADGVAAAAADSTHRGLRGDVDDGGGGGGGEGCGAGARAVLDDGDSAPLPLTLALPRNIKEENDAAAIPEAIMATSSVAACSPAAVVPAAGADTAGASGADAAFAAAAAVATTAAAPDLNPNDSRGGGGGQRTQPPVTRCGSSNNSWLPLYMMHGEGSCGQRQGQGQGPSPGHMHKETLRWQSHSFSRNQSPFYNQVHQQSPLAVASRVCRPGSGGGGAAAAGPGVHSSSLVSSCWLSPAVPSTALASAGQLAELGQRVPAILYDRNVRALTNGRMSVGYPSLMMRGGSTSQHCGLPPGSMLESTMMDGSIGDVGPGVGCAPGYCKAGPGGCETPGSVGAGDDTATTAAASASLLSTADRSLVKRLTLTGVEVDGSSGSAADGRFGGSGRVTAAPVSASLIMYGRSGPRLTELIASGGSGGGSSSSAVTIPKRPSSITRSCTRLNTGPAALGSSSSQPTKRPNSVRARLHSLLEQMDREDGVSSIGEELSLSGVSRPGVAFPGGRAGSVGGMNTPTIMTMGAGVGVGGHGGGSRTFGGAAQGRRASAVVSASAPTLAPVVQARRASTTVLEKSTAGMSYSAHLRHMLGLEVLPAAILASGTQPPSRASLASAASSENASGPSRLLIHTRASSAIPSHHSSMHPGSHPRDVHNQHLNSHSHLNTNASDGSQNTNTLGLNTANTTQSLALQLRLATAGGSGPQHAHLLQPPHPHQHSYQQHQLAVETMSTGAHVGTLGPMGALRGRGISAGAPLSNSPTDFPSTSASAPGGVRQYERCCLSSSFSASSAATAAGPGWALPLQMQMDDAAAASVRGQTGACWVAGPPSGGASVAACAGNMRPPTGLLLRTRTPPSLGGGRGGGGGGGGGGGRPGSAEGALALELELTSIPPEPVLMASRPGSARRSVVAAGPGAWSSLPLAAAAAAATAAAQNGGAPTSRCGGGGGAPPSPRGGSGPSVLSSGASCWFRVHMRAFNSTGLSTEAGYDRGGRGNGGDRDDGGRGEAGGGGGRTTLLLVMQDVTAHVTAQEKVAALLAHEHRILEALFPRHVIEFMTLVPLEMAAMGVRAKSSGLSRSRSITSRSRTRSRRVFAASGAAGVEPSTSSAPTSAQMALGTDTVADTLSSPLSPGPQGGDAGPVSGGSGPGSRSSSSRGSGWRQLVMQQQLDAFKVSHLATQHKMVTILFSDCVGFTAMCKKVSPLTVMHFLNELYQRLDALLDIYKVYKVETIGDCYVVAGGLVRYDSDGYCSVLPEGEVDQLHAVRVLEFAKAMLRTSREVVLPTSGEPVQLRLGLHSGPAMSGVVGSKMPRFTVFGETVEVAHRMESSGVPRRIHVSAATRELLRREAWEATEGVQVDGGKRMDTYLWVEDEEEDELYKQQRVMDVYL